MAVALHDGDLERDAPAGEFRRRFRQTEGEGGPDDFIDRGGDKDALPGS
ncbi:MAG: hypothetical protein IIA75_10480 [Proteobacteria bacterium]|nr:hypothetical protein [Pseudomonadota bacterium]